MFWALARIEASIRRHSKVGNPEFFQREQFPWLEPFERDWSAIRQELLPILEQRSALPAFQEISPEVGYITDDRNWKTFMLLGYGAASDRNLARCPQTARALQRIPGLITAFFSILEPGKRLPPHRGPYNGVLRLHLPLIVPKPAERCWIRVGSSIRHWNEGESLVFDDAYPHEVHNDTSGVRVVLFIDFLRPCRQPLHSINRAVIALARWSPLVRRAERLQREWEQRIYDRHEPL